MDNIIFSFIIPTYNSEKTLKYTLDSIDMQDFDKSKIEVLVLDGGSTDDTLNIAKKYQFVKIEQNEKRLPEYAKLKGFNIAVGKYVTMIDSDESFTQPDTLKKRFEALEKTGSGVLIPEEVQLFKIPNLGISCNYLIVCGDPFTYFFYKQKNKMSKSFSKNVQDCDDYYGYKFNESDKRPIADGGTTTINNKLLKELYSKSERNDISFICSVSNRMMDKTQECISIKNEVVKHASSAKFKKYLSKIKFRIINNIFAPNESGFSSRSISGNYRKYLFPFYTMSILLPLFDGIKLSLQYKDLSFLLHSFYCSYTTVLICYYYFLKILGKDVKNNQYG